MFREQGNSSLEKEYVSKGNVKLLPRGVNSDSLSLPCGKTKTNLNWWHHLKWKSVGQHSLFSVLDMLLHSDCDTWTYCH